MIPVCLSSLRKQGPSVVDVHAWKNTFTSTCSRIWQHKEGFVDGFTNRYGVKCLVWFEQHESVESAITREKQIKKWKRAWKIKLIESINPYWNDLYSDITS